MNWKFWKKKPFEKLITHDDWRAYNITEFKPLGDPGVKIPRSEHKQGKYPNVTLDNAISTSRIIENGDVMIYRGLSIERGIPFPVKVIISR